MATEIHHVKDASTDFLKRRANKSIAYLLDRFGLPSRVFKAISTNTALTGYDDGFEYEDTPFFVGRVLLPRIFSTRAYVGGNLVLDDFFQEDQFIYVANEGVFIPQNSLIVVTLANGHVLNLTNPLIQTTMHSVELYFRCKVVPAVFREGKNNAVDTPPLGDADMKLFGTIGGDMPFDIPQPPRLNPDRKVRWISRG